MDTGSFSGSGALNSTLEQAPSHKNGATIKTEARYVIDTGFLFTIMGARLRHIKTGPHNAKPKVICKEKREGHTPPFS
jgi:hypothetical protein